MIHLGGTRVYTVVSPSNCTTVYIPPPLGQSSMLNMLNISTAVGIVSVPERSALVRSLQLVLVELSEHVLFGVVDSTFLVVEQSSLENRLRGAWSTPFYRVLNLLISATLGYIPRYPQTPLDCCIVRWTVKPSAVRVSGRIFWEKSLEKLDF